MNKHFFGLLFTLALFVQLPAQAQQPTANARALSQQELVQLLTGNSNDGEWAGRPYQQYFRANGSTDYREDGGRMTSGTWRVDQDGNYCSIWPPFPREFCYELLVDGDQIFWKSEDKIYQATVISGNIFKN